jgi:hypothetical protein
LKKAFLFSSILFVSFIASFRSDNNLYRYLLQNETSVRYIDPVTSLLDSTYSGIRSLNISDKFFQGIASLEKLKYSPGYRFRVKNTSTGQSDDLHIRYQVYMFDQSDIDNDGKTEVMIGVIKPTHFEPVVAKRLFIFRIDSAQIRPLWLGSKVCMKLIDFKCTTQSGKSVISTIEKSESGAYIIGVYEWQNFGLRLIGYINENSDYKTIQIIFRNEKVSIPDLAFAVGDSLRP